LVIPNISSPIHHIITVKRGEQYETKKVGAG